MRRTKILFIAAVKHYDIFNRASAIDSILCSVLLGLNNLNYEVSINGIKLKELEEDYKKRKLPGENKVYTLSKTNFFKKIIPAKLKEAIKQYILFKYHKKLKEQLKKNEKPDIIIELMKIGSNVGGDIATYFKVPFLLYYDAPNNYEYKLIFGFYPFFKKLIEKHEQESIEKADIVIVYSNPVKDYWLKKSSKISPGKFKIFQTLDYSRMSYLEDKKINECLNIGYIGSFMKWHRVDLLLDAFNKLKSEGYNIKLSLIGAGMEYSSILNKIKKSGLQDLITTTGFIDGKTLEEKKRSIDIGVMPGSNWYNIPTKVFEYGAASIASVAPKTPTIKDIFRDKEDILLFENDSLEDLEDKLRQLIINRHLLKNIAQNLNQKMSENYTLEKAIIFYNVLIQNILSTKENGIKN